MVMDKHISGGEIAELKRFRKEAINTGLTDRMQATGRTNKFKGTTHM